MIREMEKLFESLKYEFNQKISNIGYFTNFNDPIENHVVNAGGSITDSFEDISLEDEILEKDKLHYEISILSEKILSNDTESESIPVTDDDNIFSKSQNDITSNPSDIDIDSHQIAVEERKEIINISEDKHSDVTEDISLSKEISIMPDSTQISTKNNLIEELKSTPDLENEKLLNDVKESGSEGTDVNSEVEQSNENIEKNHLSIDFESNVDRMISEEIPFIETIKTEKECENFENDQHDIVTEYEHVELDSNHNCISQILHENTESTEINKYEPITDDTKKVDDNQTMSDQCKPVINIDEISVTIGENEALKVIDVVEIEKPKKEILLRNSEIQFEPKPVTRTLSYPVKLRKTSTESTNHRKITSNRRMWSEMPEVIESGILSSISKKEIQLQEAMFEIITSEASYYRSLIILTTHFFQSNLFKASDEKMNIVSSIDRHHIFSNIIWIGKASLKLLNNLEQRWHDEKPILSDVCDVVLKNAMGKKFQFYVSYLRNQQYQAQALKRLSENEIFKQQLAKLESSPICGKLALDSYLLLPMQRLTRLKLLVEAISKLHNSEELAPKIPQSTKTVALEALEQLKKLLSTSNIEKGLMDQKSALLSLINRIDFPPNFKRITLSNRILLREEELRVHQLTPAKTVRKFSRKKQPLLTLLLFNDLLVVAKKKGARLLVLDYCDRVNVQAKLKFYTQEISSNDVSSNTSAHDINVETQVPQKALGSTLIRSKTSLCPDEKKRLSIPLNNYFGSMPSITKTDDHEIKYQTFALQLKNSYSDIFSSQIYLTALTKADRDSWLAVLNEEKCQKEIAVQSTTNIAGEILAQSEITQNWNYEFLMNKVSYECDFDTSLLTTSRPKCIYSKET